MPLNAGNSRASSTTSSVVLHRPGSYSSPADMPTAPCCSALFTSARILRDLISPRRPPHIVAHDTAAHGAVTDEQHRVRTDAGLLEQRALIGDRPRRAAVLIDDDRGDALRDEVGRRAANRIRIAKSAAWTGTVVGMRVNVDEAGRRRTCLPRRSRARPARCRAVRSRRCGRSERRCRRGTTDCRCRP